MIFLQLKRCGNFFEKILNKKNFFCSKELQDAVKESRIRGFCDVLVTEHFMQGISHLIQTSGLGGLRHNR